MAAKALIEIELLRVEQIKKSGNKNINTARARYNLGRALWLSNKPQETTLALSSKIELVGKNRICELDST